MSASRGMGGGKYVPPHLRGKQQQTANDDGDNGNGGEGLSSRRSSSLSALASSSSSVRRSVPGLRQGTTDNGSMLPSSSSPSSSRYRTDDANTAPSRDSSAAAPAATTSGRPRSPPSGGPPKASRWPDSCFSSSRTSPPSQRQGGDDDNDENDPDGPITHVKNERPPRRPTTKHRVQFYGDSFIRIFTLVKSPHMAVIPFKGGSAKGIGRDGNTNRDLMRVWVHETRPERLVLCFGSVDVHLSYFHVRSNGGDLDFAAVAGSYLDFVHDELAQVVPPGMITVVGVYPSPLDDAHVREAVCNYGSMDRDRAHLLDEANDVSNDARQGRVRLFNTLLREGCAKHGFHFADVCDEMMDPTTNMMKDSFRDVSSHNIHVVWETTVLLWMQKWPWFRDLAPQGFEESLQRTLDEYLQTKPWADRTHVASTMGVLGAFDQDR